MVHFVWWVVEISAREEWRSAIITNGELSAIITGVSLMLMLCASNLDSLVVSVTKNFLLVCYIQ